MDQPTTAPSDPSDRSDPPDPAGDGEAGDRTTGGTDDPAELLVVTGLSGAGRSTAAHALEDLGWYVVDNLPPQMLASLSGLAARAGTAVPKVAVVLDVRTRGFGADGDLADVLLAPADPGVVRRVLFLEASDDVLVRRFESVRRPHPLQGEGRVLDGIQAERELLRDLRAASDLVIDTSDRNIHQLGAAIGDLFAGSERARLRLTLVSFGFKYGLPTDADHVVDVRFLPNPYWVPALRGHTGRESEVSAYVLGQEGAEEFLERYTAALQPVLEGYRRENRSYATVAIGCTGGKHRSVAMSERLAELLRATGPTAPAVRVTHRDLGRE